MTIDTSKLPKSDTIKISYDTTSVTSQGIASTIDSTPYTISFDSTTMVDPTYSTVTANSTPITIDIGENDFYNKTFDKWPSEVIIDDMITKYPGLKLQYEKFMTVYNLVKDDYTYEEPINDGSV
jgi:hypothetical protein